MGLLSKLAEMVENAQKAQFDPQTLNDPIAKATQWHPMQGGGSNFRTHSLVKKGEHQLAFKASFGSIIFSCIFILVGCGVFILGLEGLFTSRTHLTAEVCIPLLFGLVFTAVGIYILKSSTQPIVFERQMQTFFKGSKPARKPSNTGDYTTPRHRMETQDSIQEGAILFKDIHALQILSEYCRGNKSSYYSYELNLVLTNGQRINVVDHGGIKQLRKDAETISQFIGKPVWDASV